MPGPYYYWPGNPVIKFSGVSRYHFGGEAAGFSSWNDETKSVLFGGAAIKGVRLRRTTYFNWIPACGENDGVRGQW
ncbi:hypothetical protein [Candidatus Spongiihabitans sp.]|uniref:hypothetical protein n=1 Tax=Candidatus Spongiihabitans sp. TaxID=3101308 RepID=UPI003C7D9AB8